MLMATRARRWLLPTLAFAGLATFHRVLQTGIEDLAYARRVAQPRDYYFDHAPELAGYLLNPAERLPTPGLGIGLWQQFLTVAGMVAVITAVLAGSAGGLLAAVASGHSLAAALVAGLVVAAAALTGLMRYQNSAWKPGQHVIVVPRRTSRTELKPAWTKRAICRAPPTRPEDRVNGQIGRAATSGLPASMSGMVVGIGVCGLVTGRGYLRQRGVGSKGGSLVLPGARVPSAHMPGLGATSPGLRYPPRAWRAYCPFCGLRARIIVADPGFMADPG
ncbi:MAG TPA: hypothetical protein VHN16_04100, partial [Streptosporangiaceae bacterium]|nr:hypothetical protein [Streptosporangiaceae bacterium]